MFTSLSFDPFATKGILTLPTLEINTDETWHGFTFDGELRSELLSLADTEPVKLGHLQADVLKLSLEDLPLQDFDSLDHTSITTSEDEDRERHTKDESKAQIEEDVWKFEDVQEYRHENKLVSWDHFLDQQHQEPHTAYVSEAGTAVFDLLLRKSAAVTSEANDLKYARHDVLLSALFDLGLGRGSGFFAWNGTKQLFEKKVSNYTLSGVSKQLLDEVISRFLEIGTQCRLLEQSSGVFRKDQSNRIALIGAMTTVISAITEHVEGQRCHVRTIIQLNETFRKPRILVKLLDHLRQHCLSNQPYNDFLVNFLNTTERLAQQELQLEDLMHEISARVTMPFIQLLIKTIKLSADGNIADEGLMGMLSAIMPTSITSMIQSVQISLLALEGSEDFNSLTTNLTNSNTDMMVGQSYQDIMELQDRADCYEQRVKNVILASQEGYTVDKKSGGTLINSPLSNFARDTDPFMLSTAIFDTSENALNSLLVRTDDSLLESVRLALSEEVDQSPTVDFTCQQGLILSITPILTAQHRLLSYSVLQLVFKGHNLQTHLNILNRLQLLTDGVFISRLSTALFDSDQDSGEVNRRNTASIELRLQSRDTWPPASSELRLALMGILSESVSDTKMSHVIESISFAIRDLDDDELERCRDINSIYALDFLRLHYKSPSTVLEAIITQKSLEDYDRIFKCQFRLLRMKSLGQSLLRQKCGRNNNINNPSAHKFPLEIQHFITTLANYSSNIAIATPWNTFTKKLTKIEEKLNNKDYEGTLSLVQGLDHLRQLHENVLADIKHGLLLKKKQSKARIVLEDIFGLVFEYAALISRERHNNEKTKNDEVMMLRLYARFKDKVRDFIALVMTMTMTRGGGYCGGGSGDGGSGKDVDVNVDVDVLDQLVLCLDFNGYYMRSRETKPRKCK